MKIDQTQIERATKMAEASLRAHDNRIADAAKEFARKMASTPAVWQAVAATYIDEICWKFVASLFKKPQHDTGSFGKANIAERLGSRGQVSSVYASVFPNQAEKRSHLSGVNQTTIASSSLPDPKRERNGQYATDTHLPSAISSPAPVRPMDTKGNARIMRNCILDTFIVFDKPIRQLSVSLLLSRARANDRDSRFLRMLCEGKQPDMVIGKYVTDDEAQQMWTRANKMQQEAA